MERMPKWLHVLLLTVAVVVLLLFVVVSTASYLLNKRVKAEVERMFASNIKGEEKVISSEDLQGLPQPVRKWLERSGVVGKEVITSVRMKQKGMMRTKENGQWMPATAEQYYTVEEPGFIWKARVKMLPFLYFTGLDRYQDGKGYMSIKVLSLVPVVNAQGPEADQGTLLRYLGEMAWFPTAALSDYIKWEPVDSHSSRAVMSYGGVTASAVFSFNDSGDLAGITARRYREAGGRYVLEDWAVTAVDYREFGGFRIPNRMDVTWKLKTGDFTWYRVEVTEVEYNRPDVY